MVEIENRNFITTYRVHVDYLKSIIQTYCHKKEGKYRASEVASSGEIHSLSRRHLELSTTKIKARYAANQISRNQ